MLFIGLVVGKIVVRSCLQMVNFIGRSKRKHALEPKITARPIPCGICRVRIRDAMKLANDFPVFCGADLSHLPSAWIPALRRAAAGIQHFSDEWGVAMRVTGIGLRKRVGNSRIETNLYEFSGHPRFLELALLDYAVRKDFEAAVSNLG